MTVAIVTSIHLETKQQKVMFDHGNGSPFVWPEFYTVTPLYFHIKIRF